MIRRLPIRCFALIYRVRLWSLRQGLWLEMGGFCGKMAYLQFLSWRFAQLWRFGLSTRGAGSCYLVLI